MAVMTRWQKLLSTHFPIFVVVETSGVRSEDVPSAIGLGPPVVPAVTFLSNIWQVPEEKLNDCAKFLGMSLDEYRTYVGYDSNGFQLLFKTLLEEIEKRNAPPLFVSYNTPFQGMFLDKLLDGNLPSVPWLDITRLGWCLSETKAINEDIDSIELLNQYISEITNGQKGMDYRTVFERWGIPLPPTTKTVTKVGHIISMWNKISHWSYGTSVPNLPYVDSVYPAFPVALTFQ